MKCIRIVLFVFFIAFLSSLTAVDATDYIIPEACPTAQQFPLNGSTMSGSTFMYNNPQNLSVQFEFFFPESSNRNASVTIHTGSRTIVYNKSFDEKVEKESMNFSLTGTWLAGDGGSVIYHSADLGPEGCDNRTATNLLVRGVYEISQMKVEKYSIWALANCGVKITLDGKRPVSPCNATLKFDDGRTMNASSVGETVTSMNGPISFGVYSDCDFAQGALYYQEDCRSTTAATSESTVSRSPSESTDQSTASTPQTTESSKATVSMSSTIGTSQSTPSISPIVTATEPMISTTPATATSESTVSRSPSSGINVVARALPITFALVLSVVQRL